MSGIKYQDSYEAHVEAYKGHIQRGLKLCSISPRAWRSIETGEVVLLTCVQCQIEKSVSAFSKLKTSIFKVKSTCKVCILESEKSELEAEVVNTKTREERAKWANKVYLDKVMERIQEIEAEQKELTANAAT